LKVDNQSNHKVKTIKSDNGTEFKNRILDSFCSSKGITRQDSAARTPQQNGVAKRRNRTLIEAARTMLSDSKLPLTFWAEAVSTACYVQIEFWQLSHIVKHLMNCGTQESHLLDFLSHLAALAKS
jgi:transposase InsO family protein